MAINDLERLEDVRQPEAAAASDALDTHPLGLCLQGAAMGPHFRSIALTLSAAFAGSHMMVHTVFFPAGSPGPTAGEVAGFADEEALTRRGAARAVFPVFADERGAPLTRALHGREGVRPFPGETGLIDGLRYDVYAVGITEDGARTALCPLCGAVAAMPFSGGDGRPETPFLLRQLTEGELREAPDLKPGHPLNRAGVAECARMLDNIEGMRALCAQTRGGHGLPGALGFAYRLTTTFDLSGYAQAYGGQGWRPIGDEENPFTGVLEGAHPSIAIMGMSMRRGGADGACSSALGLVGALRGGTLRTLWLDHPRISAVTAPGRQSYIGGLAGTASGLLENLRVTQGRFTGGCLDGNGCAWIGGIVGAALDGAAIRGARVSDTVLEAGATSHAALGGIAGRMALDGGGSVTLTDSAAERVTLRGVQDAGGLVPGEGTCAG